MAGIFCSPYEPRFNDHPACIDDGLLGDCFSVLTQENNTVMRNASNKQGFFKSGRYAEEMFVICGKINLPEEAKYLAMEMFDKFMTQHILDLYPHVTSAPRLNQMLMLDSIIERVGTQVPLRMLSCCQIASKLTSHYRVITPQKVRNVLRDMGCLFGLSSILQSEIRVMKTLNYKVMLSSPLVYMDAILNYLDKEIEIEVKAYHNLGMNILDIVYIRRQQLYKDLYQLATRNMTPSQESRNMFTAVENDNILLAVTVVAMVSYVMGGQKLTLKVLKIQSKLTGTPAEGVTDFTSLISAIILEGQDC